MDKETKKRNIIKLTFSIASIFNDKYFQEALHSKQAKINIDS